MNRIEQSYKDFADQSLDENENFLHLLKSLDRELLGLKEVENSDQSVQAEIYYRSTALVRK